MSSIMRARSALTGRSEGWEVIGDPLELKGCWTFNARDRMLRSSRPTAYSAPYTHRPSRALQSRESGFVLGASGGVPASEAERPVSDSKPVRRLSMIDERLLRQPGK